MNGTDQYPESSACIAQFSLGSIIKISFILGLCASLLAFAIYLGVALIRTLIGNTSPIHDYLRSSLISALMMTATETITAPITGLLAYPIYRWICDRKGGHIYRGRIRLL